MNIMYMKKLILVLVIVFSGVIAKAQSDTDIWELVKTDLKVEYKTILVENMVFTDAEAEVFWPIFNEYMLKKNANLDQNMAILKDYAEHYDDLTDEKIEGLVKQTQSQRSTRLKNRNAYYKSLKKALGVRKAAKLFQIDGQINTLFDFQLASQIPIIE
ncbi:MAG: hypothetical protein DRI54_04445 [Bacteroidetes bacterium]|nr:MAG: hypothetical protein DRI54_04445 [Bacteroidota bacterium]